MLTRIGRPRDTSDLVDKLIDCHGRIRRLSGLARTLAGSAGAPEEEIRDAAGAIYDYFTRALPLHVRDEEESVLPRLYGRSTELDRALAVMARQHVEHEVLIGRLVSLVAALHAEPRRLAELAVELGNVATPLERELAAHLEHEETVVFPAIGRLLDATTQTAIAREIAARRSAGAPEA